MSRREAALSGGVVFALALVVRAVAAAGLRFPVPEDTAYYVGVARNLVDGRGLVSDALWSYQTQPLVVPRAAFEVWLPLPSLLDAIPMAVLGAGNWFRAAQVASIVIGALVALLAWRLGADVAEELRLPAGRARTLAIGSGVVACVLAPLVVYGTLPDSTMPFAAISLGACLLMSRVSARPAGDRRFDPRLLALGVTIGLGALTRSETVWLVLAWLLVVWRWTPGSARDRLPLVLVPGAVAALIYAPWAVRDWLVFGSPLPGQAVANALSVNAFDIFAYRDQPTVARYLGQGVASLVEMRIGGFVHNVVDVLFVPAVPVGPIGLLALPLLTRLRSVRPLLLTAVTTFLAAGLVFPVSTTWGTFLHAAGATYVLLVISCLVALDRAIVWIGRLRHWTRPVAWLGPALAAAVAVPLLAVSMVSLDRTARDAEARYGALPGALAHAGVRLTEAGPVIADHPIWLAEANRVPSLALPEESPAAVLDLAHRFGATLLVVQADGTREWPAVLQQGGDADRCFQEVPLIDIPGGDTVSGPPLAQTHVFRIVCP